MSPALPSQSPIAAPADAPRPGAREPGPQAVAAAERSPRIVLLVLLAASAGAIHAKAFVEHAGHYWLFGVFFAVLAYAQVGWAIWVYRHPREVRWLRPVAVGSLAVIGVWVLSRTAGLPIGPWAGRAEPVRAADAAASLNELVLAGVILAMLHPRGRLAARLAWLDGANCQRVGTMLFAFSLLGMLFGSHSHAETP